MAEIYPITGPPGCGKTTHLEREIKEAVESEGGENILVVSLTKAAMTEILGRALKLPKNNAGTLHSICLRALSTPELTQSHLQEWNDHTRNPDHHLTIQFCKKSIEDIGMDELGQTQGDFYFSRMNIYRAQMLPRDKWPNFSVRNFAKEWFEWMEENSYTDFTGLIEECLDRILIAPGAPRTIIGDEVQDWSKLEMAVVMQWAEHAETVLLAGDPDQTVYDWRGADSNCFVNLDVPEANKRYLTQSYRLPAIPHKFARGLIKRIRNREDVEFKSRIKDGEVIQGQLEYNDTVYQDPESMIHRIEQEIMQNKSVMILASCAYMLNPMIAVLKQMAIPFHNPYRASNSYWNPLGRIRDSVLPADIVLSYLKPDPDTWGDFAEEWTLKDLKNWLPALNSKGVLKHGLKKQLQSTDFKVPENYEDFESLFASPGQAEKAVSLDMEWFQKNAIPKLQKPVEYFMKVFKKRGGKFLRERPRVIVGTIHSVKGGEADTVIIYPDLSRKGFNTTHESEKGMESMIRLFYVGATRTRDKLILCSSTGAQFEW